MTHKAEQSKNKDESPDLVVDHGPESCIPNGLERYKWEKAIEVITDWEESPDRDPTELIKDLFPLLR